MGGDGRILNTNKYPQFIMGYQPRSKMVTNSFGNRNFMQPMGRLSMHSKCLVFFLILKFCVRGGGGIFFIFPLFSTCSQWVPIRFSIYVPKVPKVFPKHLAFILYPLPKVLLL